MSTTQNSCQEIGSELACFYRESLGRTKFVAQRDGGSDGSDREVTQADQNDINSQWPDLDELLSEYEQHRSTSDIAITENLTIRLENAVRALQNVSHLVSESINKEAAGNG